MNNLLRRDAQLEIGRATFVLLPTLVHICMYNGSGGVYTEARSKRHAGKVLENDNAKGRAVIQLCRMPGSVSVQAKS